MLIVFAMPRTCMESYETHNKRKLVNCQADRVSQNPRLIFPKPLCLVISA